MASKYKIGDLVWAKLKTFHAWPGKIVEPKPEIRRPADKKLKHFVFFFGTNNYAWASDDQIWPYVEFRAKFMMTHRVPQAFKEAIAVMDKTVAGSGSAGQTEAVSPTKQAGLPSIEEEIREIFPDRSKRDQSKQTPTVTKGKRESSSATDEPAKKARLSADKKDASTGGQRKRTKRASQVDTSSLLPDILSSSSVGLSSVDTPWKIGFLGLGTMGSSIASALLQAGYDVTVWNRTPSKCRDFVNQGAVKGISPADVVQSCDITFSCVSDSVALKELVSGDSGVLAAIKPGKAFVDLSSVDMETVIELYESVTVRGGRFLEAPLVGTLQQQQSGEKQLPIALTAGDQSLYEDCLACFSSFAKKTFYLGEVGSASSMKLVVNMLFGVMLAGLAETLALGEKVGLQQEQILEILTLLPISSTLNVAKGDAMLNGRFNPPQLSLEHMQRGLRTAITVSEPVQQPVVVASATNELFKKAKARGYGDHDTSAIYRATD